MAYGIIKLENYSGSYVATATGYPPLNAVQPDLKRESLSRSGENGNYSKGGIAWILKPILLLKRKPVGFTFVKRYRKVYYEVTKTRSRRVKIIRLNRTYYFKVVTTTEKIRRYRWEGYSEKRAVWGFTPIRVFKRVPVEVQPHMVFGPHPLVMRSESIIDSSSVNITGSMPANPSWSSSLFASGSIKCRLAEQSSVIGFNASEYSHSKVPSGFTTQLLTSAKYKLVNKGQSATVQLANAALEANSLKGAVLNFVLDAIQTYTSFKRKIASTLDPKIRERMSNEFFAWSWGIVPTINDIKKTADAMKQSVWRKYEATVTDKFPISDAYNTTRFSGTVKGSLEVSVKCGVIVTGTYGASYLGRQISNGGLLSTAYEAIPFSFAIDWLVPLGTYLAAPEVFPKSSVHSYYETVFVRGDFAGEGSVLTHDFAGRKYNGGGAYSFAKTVASCVRTCPSWNPSLPSPTLTTGGDRFRQAGYAILLTLQRLK